MTFHEATTKVTAACISLADVAQAAGVSDSLIRRARLNPNSSAFRSPPSGWRRILATLARERADKLKEFADQLEHDDEHAPE